MDIQEERKAFEKALVDKCGFNPESSFSVDDKGEYKSDATHFGWVMWQAAKAQVPVGFVLVPKERLANVVDGIEKLFEEDCTLTLGELLPIQQDLKAIIEAQEQSHD